MIPTQLLMIPPRSRSPRLGLINGPRAAIVPWSATAFGTFLVAQRQFIATLVWSGLKG